MPDILKLNTLINPKSCLAMCKYLLIQTTTSLHINRRHYVYFLSPKIVSSRFSCVLFVRVKESAAYSSYIYSFTLTSVFLSQYTRQIKQSFSSSTQTTLEVVSYNFKCGLPDSYIIYIHHITKRP